nr:MAG TPA: hypothetical protein [Caudoviricetes sp.]
MQGRKFGVLEILNRDGSTEMSMLPSFFNGNFC